MNQSTNAMVILASIGHAMLFALAMAGAAGLIGDLMGHPVSATVRSNIFLFGTLLLAPPAAYFRIASWAMPVFTQKKTS